MRNPLPGGPGFFSRGPITPAPVVPTTAAGQQQQFWSAPCILFPRYSPPTYTGDEHSPI
jgi:hypothetical protein